MTQQFHSWVYNQRIENTWLNKTLHTNIHNITINNNNLKSEEQPKRPLTHEWITLNSHTNSEKEKWNHRNQVPWLYTIQQNYSNQNSMVLAWKQKYWSMEQHRKSRDKPMHFWSIDVWQRRQGYTMEKRQSLQQVMLGKLDSYM